MNEPEVKIKLLHPKAKIPTYATDGSGCFDIYAIEKTVIKPNLQTVVLKTGFAVEIPEGYCLEIYPRSGISIKTFLRQTPSVGIVDSDYRGEVCVPMYNAFQASRTMFDEQSCVHSINGARYHDTSISSPLAYTYVIQEGERIAQGKLVKTNNIQFVQVDELSSTNRGTNGFGSTGTK